MMHTRATSAHSVLAIAALLLAPAALPASGSGSMSAPRVDSQQRLTPEQEAVSLYNDGISYRDKAAKLEAEASTETDAKKREKLEAKATGPYMHDGRFATLDAVINHYAHGGTPGRNRSPLVTGFAITEEEKCDLIAFLESLTDEGFLKDPRFSNPWPRDNHP